MVKVMASDTGYGQEKPFFGRHRTEDAGKK